VIVPDPEPTFNLPLIERKPMTTLAPTFPSTSLRRHAFDEDGFTLLEILVGIAIMGILASFAVTSLAGVTERWQNEEAVGQSARKVQAEVDKWKNNNGSFNEVDTQAFGDIIGQQPSNVHIKVVQKHALVNGVDIDGDYQIHGWADEGRYSESNPYVLDPLEKDANTAPSA
jgi:prepilin-type N-terminal cleavage/methylation domain-containing protein